MAPFKVKIIQLSNLYRLAFFSSLLGIFIFIADFGFDQGDVVQGSINAYYFFVLILGIVASIVRYLSEQRKIPFKVLVFDVGSILFTIGVLIVHFFFWHKESIDHILYNDNWIKFAIILTFIRELSEKRINYKRTIVNPAQLFIMSFMLIILLGALMLMLPNATKGGISFLDALFTSTSAVCVTVLVGRSGDNHQTWEWDGQKWEQVIGFTPAVYLRSPFAYDEAAQVIRTFAAGQGDNPSVRAMWEYSNRTWRLTL